MSTDSAPPLKTTATPAALPATPPVPPAVDLSALPDDPALLKQMIADLLRELRKTRRDQQAVQQRLDAVLRRLHGPRPQPSNPNQPLLFADADTPAPPPPAPPPPADEDKQ